MSVLKYLLDLLKKVVGRGHAAFCPAAIVQQSWNPEQTVSGQECWEILEVTAKTHTLLLGDTSVNSNRAAEPEDKYAIYDARARSRSARFTG